MNSATGDVGEARRRGDFARVRAAWLLKASLELLMASGSERPKKIGSVMAFYGDPRKPWGGQERRWSVLADRSAGTFVVTDMDDDVSAKFTTVRDTMRFMTRGGRMAPHAVILSGAGFRDGQLELMDALDPRRAQREWRHAMAPAAAATIQASWRGVVARRRAARKRLGDELRHAPPRGSFPGGSEYRRAQKSFERSAAGAAAGAGAGNRRPAKRQRTA